MGKFFVTSTALTPADRLRELLDKAEQLVAGLRGAGPQALVLLHLLDQVTDLLAELEATGADVRAERARLGTVQRQLCRQQGRFLAEAGKAFPEARTAIQPDPARWWWFLDEAAARQRRQRVRRALAGGLVGILACVVVWWVYDRFIAPSPEAQQSFRHNATGERLVEAGDLRTALAEFEAAAALTPDDPALWVWQGVIHLELGELDEAQPAFDTARSLYETDSDFLLERGRIYLLVGNLEAASADIEQVVALDPQSGMGYYFRSNIAVAREDYAAAVADLEKAAELAQAAGDSQLEATARVQRAMVMQLWTAQMSPTPTP
jgi:tetratricopeptide (TPR) repeat protein